MDDDALLFADDECAPIASKNCLFFNNEASGGLGDSVQIGKNGHREGDPLFVDAPNGDFRLTEASPAIDNADSLNGIKKDCVGNPRPQGIGVDIGAYEFVSRTAASGNSCPVQNSQCDQAVRWIPAVIDCDEHSRCGVVAMAKM